MMMRGYELLIGYWVNVTCVCVFRWDWCRCSGSLDKCFVSTHTHTPR